MHGAIDIWKVEHDTQEDHQKGKKTQMDLQRLVQNLF